VFTVFPLVPCSCSGAVVGHIALPFPGQIEPRCWLTFSASVKRLATCTRERGADQIRIHMFDVDTHAMSVTAKQTSVILGFGDNDMGCVDFAPDEKSSSIVCSYFHGANHVVKLDANSGAVLSGIIMHGVDNRRVTNFKYLPYDADATSGRAEALRAVREKRPHQAAD
jgi:hypothetical protein